MPSSTSMSRSRKARVGGLLDHMLAGEAPEGLNMTQGTGTRGRTRSREDEDGGGRGRKKRKTEVQVLRVGFLWMDLLGSFGFRSDCFVSCLVLSAFIFEIRFLR